MLWFTWQFFFVVATVKLCIYSIGCRVSEIVYNCFLPAVHTLHCCRLSQCLNGKEGRGIIMLMRRIILTSAKHLWNINSVNTSEHSNCKKAGFFSSWRGLGGGGGTDCRNVTYFVLCLQALFSETFWKYCWHLHSLFRMKVYYFLVFLCRGFWPPLFTFLWK